MSCKSCEQARNLLNRGGNIFEGWSNLLVTNPEVELIAKQRLEICLACPFKVKLIAIAGTQLYACSKCTGVPCPIDAKVRSLNEVCPKGKW